MERTWRTQQPALCYAIMDTMIIFPLYSDWALLALRLILGGVFVAHGFPKLKNWKGTTQWFQSIGFKPGWLWGTVAGLLEFFGGIALVIGLRTRFAALFLALQFAVIIIWKLARKTPMSGQNGWELDLVILGALLALLTVGGGMYSF
jgi:putative oxidoreductase